MGEHSAPEPPGIEMQVGQVSATQTQFPWRSTARTVFQAGVGFAAMAPLIIDASGVPEGTAGVGAALAISAGITRVMALPAVDEFLRRWLPWLATAPTDR